ncbi:hypothetical protein C8R44DRAFT_557222, partial [Mycena epipterygia]
MDLNIATLLSTNSLPSDVEVQQIHAILNAGDMELAELNAQISQVTSQLAELKAKSKQRSELFRSLRAVLSPLRRFPAELLAEIFECCCHNSLAAEFYSITDPLEAPVLLGHICSFWRTVSHNTPRLW